MKVNDFYPGIKGFEVKSWLRGKIWKNLHREHGGGTEILEYFSVNLRVSSVFSV
jgi:hypothetical protein